MVAVSINVIPQHPVISGAITVHPENHQEILIERAFLMRYEIVKVVGRTHTPMGEIIIALHKGVLYVQSIDRLKMKGLPDGFAVKVLHTPNNHYVIQRTLTADKGGYKVELEYIEGNGLTLVFS